MQQDTKLTKSDDIANWIRMTVLLSMVFVSFFYAAMVGVVPFLPTIIIGFLSLVLKFTRVLYNVFTSITYFSFGVSLKSLEFDNNLSNVFMLVGAISLSVSIVSLLIDIASKKQ